MIGKKVKLRITFLILLLISLSLIVFLIFKTLEENIVYFKSPTEINNLPELVKDKVRIGGMVKKDSIKINGNEINFVITDFKNEIQVSFKGAIPNLFEEEKGVVAEGFIKDRKYFVAKKVLAKHDENYMPPEVKSALEKDNAQ